VTCPNEAWKSVTALKTLIHGTRRSAKAVLAARVREDSFQRWASSGLPCSTQPQRVDATIRLKDVLRFG
jgi:hypothetical protein